MTTNGNAVQNLRAAKRQQTQARTKAKADHPAGKALPKPGPATAPAKAPAKKAPKAATPASAKLRWTLLEERQPGKAAVPQVGKAGDAEYTIDRSGEAWRVTVKLAGKTSVLADNVSYAKTYAVVVEHNKNRQAKEAC